MGAFMLKTRNQIEIQQKLQKEMGEQGIDALILTNPDSVYYATGYASSFLYGTMSIGFCMALVLADGLAEVLVPEIEKQTAYAQCKDVKIHTFPTWIYIDDEEADTKDKPEQPDFCDAFNILTELIIARKPDSKVGMESGQLPHQFYEHAVQLFGDNLTDSGLLLRKVRAVKTEWEIDLLRRGAKGSERAMLEVAGYMEAGWTQKNIYDAFRQACYRQDPEIDGWGFGPSIGKNYSMMNMPLEDYVLEEGDIVRLDGGPQIHKYNSDLARTIVIGRPRPGQEELYAALKKAHDVGAAMMGPGVRCADVFHAMMEIVWKAGYTSYQRGHLGHSMGCSLSTEEYPFIAAANPGVFEPGMVFCLETPYYSRKLGGFNIEDEILITENGIERWTYANEDLFWGRKY